MFGVGIETSGQEEEEQEKDWGITFSGYVKNDVFYDSRQTVAAREGHFLLWPKKEQPDQNGNDINAQSSYNILAVQSRLSGKITGPDALGAKTSGVIEGDFFAQANSNINLFRLRHAFLKLDWGQTNLIMGQYWNPIFVTACYPGTISFNTGVPFQAFARNPQIRLTQEIAGLNVMLAALAQRDYPSWGADGPTSKYLRNSGTPDMHFQIHYLKERVKIGAGVAYKTIVPELMTDSLVKTDNQVAGLSAVAFMNFNLNAVTLKLEGIYGQNNTDIMQPSGFAAKSIDPVTNVKDYTPIQNTSVWMDIHTNGKPVQAGLFAGYYKKLGTPEEISGSVYGLGTQIASMYRISPRVVYNAEKVRLATELEYTSAEFGANYDAHAVPENLSRTNNLRLLFSAYYFF